MELSRFVMRSEVAAAAVGPCETGLPADSFGAAGANSVGHGFD